MIQVTIMAPNPILRTGLREILHGVEDITVIGEISSPDELRYAKAEVDVLVIVFTSATRANLSRYLPNGEGKPAILALTDEATDLVSLTHLPIRAWGILPPDADASEIINATRALSDGLIVGSPSLLKPITNRLILLEGSQSEPMVEPLTERECEVLQQIAQGLANKQIAAALGISEHTVKFHLSSIYAKLGATNRTDAVRLGTSQGLINL